MCETIGGKIADSARGTAMGTPCVTRSLTWLVASSMRLLPAVAPVISSERMMSTPAATSVESVREKRAIPILMITLPMPAGARTRILSQRRRPDSVFL
jgi:hypothetical protein